MARMGRDRTKNRRFPLGWKLVNGIIYFVPTNAGDKAIVMRLTGKGSMRLGKTHDDAATVYAGIVKARQHVADATPGTVSELCQRAREEYLPRLTNKDTREGEERHVEALDRLFGSRRYAKNVYDASRVPEYLKALDIQRHLDLATKPDEDGKTRAVSANREVRTWRKVFRDARIRWGLTEYNPCEGVVMNAEHARDILPQEDSLQKAYKLAPVWLQCMIDISRFYGRRRGEQLKLMVSDVQDDGLHFRRGKTRGGAAAKEIIFKWDPELRAIVDRLLAWRKLKMKPAVSSMALIVNQRGSAVTITGYNSAWKRLVKKAEIKGEFNFHDLRALRATTLTLERATEVLAHDDPGTTKKVYRRGPIVLDMNSENRPKNSEKTG
jgi:integrase